MDHLTELLYEYETKLMHYRLEDFKALLADDFIEFGTSGNKYDKAIFLEQVSEPGIDEIPFTVSDFKVQQLAENVAHVTFKTESKEDGKKSLRSSIWRYDQLHWKLYFHQGTRTDK